MSYNFCHNFYLNTGGKMFELQERADLIKKERKKQSLSQQQLADKVGCSLRTIQRLEKGDDISDKYLRKIAEVIGLNDNQLLVDQKATEIRSQHDKNDKDSKR